MCPADLLCQMAYLTVLAEHGSGRTIGALNQNVPERDQRSRGDTLAR